MSSFKQPSLNLELLGRYKITKLITNGSYGSVCQAYEKERERTVIIKFAKDTELVTSLREEAELLQTLSHPGIPQIHSPLLEDDCGPFFALEFIRGKPLSALKGKLVFNDIINIAQQATAILAYLHKIKVVHFDINPSNWLYDLEEKKLVLVDFGLAVKTVGKKSGLYQKISPRRNPQYLPPEVVKAINSSSTVLVTPAVDIYGLGRVLEELVQNMESTPIPNFLNLLTLMQNAKPKLRPTTQSIQAELTNLASKIIATENQAPSPFESLPLLGRSEEQIYLQQCLLDCSKELRGKSIIIAGQAGVGKTRLLGEWQREAREKFNYLVISGAVYENDTDVHPFAPLARILQACLVQVNLPTTELILYRLDSLLPNIGIITKRQNSELPDQQDSEKLALGLLTFWQSLITKSGKPLFICLEDVHFADDTLLQILKFIQEQILKTKNNYPLVVALTFRTENQQSQVRFRTYLGEPDLNLMPLQISEIEELLLKVGLERDALGYLAELAQSLYHHTGGRPLLIKEELLLLQAKKLIKKKDTGSWQLSRDINAHDLALDLNRRATEPIKYRLQLLLEEEQKIVRSAALLGFTFELELLGYVCEKLSKLAPSQTESYVQALIKAGIFVYTEKFNIYQFSHDLLFQEARQNTALGNISRWEIADKVETYYAITLQDPVSGYSLVSGQPPFMLGQPNTDRNLLPLLAHIYQNSLIYRAECGYTLLAAEQALAANANNLAKRHYEQVLLRLAEAALKDPLDFEDEADEAFIANQDWRELTKFYALKGLARAYYNGGFYEETIATSQKAISTATEYNKFLIDEFIAQVYSRWMTALYMLSRYEEAISLADSSLTPLTTPGALDIRLSYGLVLHRLGNRKEAYQLTHQILQQAQVNEDKANQIRSYNQLAIIENDLGNFSQVLSYASKALELAEAVQSFEGIDKAYSMLINAHWGLNNSEQWYYYSKIQLKAIAENKISGPDRIWNAYNLMGLYHMVMSKDFGEAARYFEWALNIALQALLVEEQGVVQLNLGYLYIEMENLTTAKKYLDQARVIYEAGQNRTHFPTLYKNFGTYYKLCGQLDEAKHYYSKALEWATQLKNKFEIEDCTLKIAELSRQKKTGAPENS